LIILNETGYLNKSCTVPLFQCFGNLNSQTAKSLIENIFCFVFEAWESILFNNWKFGVYVEIYDCLMVIFYEWNDDGDTLIIKDIINNKSLII